MEKIEKFKSELFDNIFEYIQCISIFFIIEIYII